MHENRETSETPAVKPGSRSAGEGDSRTAHANVSEESHNGIVPMNYSNNDKTSSAESGEGRPLIKENAGQPNTQPTQSGERVSQGLAGVRKAAREHKEMRFTALLHHLTIDLLRESFYSVKKKAAYLWVNVWRQKWAQGEVVVIRYADDSIAGFQYQTDADRFLENLRERLAMFGLELHPDKTRRIEFGRFAEENRKRRGGWETGDVRFPGLHPHQWEEQPGTVCSSAQDDRKTHAGKASTRKDGAPQANARSLVPNRSVAQIDRARPLQLLRGTRQHRKPIAVQAPAACALVAYGSPPQSDAPDALDTNA